MVEVKSLQPQVLSDINWVVGLGRLASAMQLLKASLAPKNYEEPSREYFPLKEIYVGKWVSKSLFQYCYSE